MIRSVFLAAGLVLCANNASAENILVNGDFANGRAAWKGAGKDASGVSLDAVGAPLSNQGSVTGMSVKLKPDGWTYVWQPFHTRESALVLSVTYSTSADFTLVDGSEHRGSVESEIAILLQLPIHTGTNPLAGGITIDATHPASKMVAQSALAFVRDPAQSAIVWSFLKLTAAPGGTTSTVQIDKLMPHEDKAFYLALPPGTGTMTFTNISLEKPDAAPATPASPLPR